jgi:phosphatidylinositol alpha-mannosyltransferase
VRIAQVCPYDFFRPGGVQSHIRGLSNELRRRGHEVVVLAPRGARAGEGVRFVGSSLKVPFNRSQIDLSLARSTGGLGRFDLVHYHTFWNPFVTWQLRAALRAPSISTFHDTPPKTLFGSLCRAVMPAAAGLISRCMGAVVAVSPSTLSVLEPFCRNAHLIPNGLCTADFEPRPDEPELLYLGRLEGRKGVDVLLRAFGRLSPRFPEWTLIVAGDGPLRSRLEALAPPRTRFLGEVDEVTKRALLSRCALLCAPSVDGESFGLVLAEAMASGKPPVAAANEGYRSLLTGPLERLLVPPGDPEALSGRLQELLGDPVLRHDLGREARAHVQRYDWSRIADQVESLYASLVA